MANIPLKSITFPGLEDTYTIPQVESLAPAYIQSNAYAVGDLVTHDNKLYKCIVQTTAGETWTAAHWTETTIDGALDVLNAAGNVRYDQTQSLTDLQKMVARGNVGAASAADLEALKAVRYDTTQTLTDTQKQTARSNVGAASAADLEALAAVRYDSAQNLTTAQKQTARSNIGAVELASDLTETGKAADAKLVGDELTDLKDDLSETVKFTAQTLTEAQKAQVALNIDGISRSAKNALYECFNHVSWLDGYGDVCKDALYSMLFPGEPKPADYLYQLSAPVAFDGTSTYIDTGVKLLSDDISFTILADLDEDGIVATNNNMYFLFAITGQSASFYVQGRGVDTTRIQYALRVLAEQGLNVKLAYSSTLNSHIRLCFIHQKGSGTYNYYISIDGTQYSSSGNYELGNQASENTLFIGASPQKNSLFKGTLNTFSVYNYAISETEAVNFTNGDDE